MEKKKRKKENRKTLVRKSQPNKVQIEGKEFFFLPRQTFTWLNVIWCPISHCRPPTCFMIFLIVWEEIIQKKKLIL